MLGKEVELLVLNRAVSRDAEDFMQMRISDFLERCSA
jgi:hypothetical protein